MKNKAIITPEMLSTISYMQQEGMVNNLIDFMGEVIDYVIDENPPSLEGDGLLSRMRMIQTARYFQKEMETFIVKEGGEQ
ncbi:MAG: hypothetical protein KH897_03605 [Bacteroides sp.]|jgi:hypothetical protein|uniref:hypothetical protein n=1 Tax=Bacteroides sp. TaxID=29523 RepID=UPI0025B7B588|nr:hypothetical protein [Bacteroides sp.]MBS6237471.1 hypothetical protein [Bacteroides sp.]